MKVGVVLLLLVVACSSKTSGGQTFREGMEALCSAAEQPEVAKANPAERQAKLSAAIAERVTNAEARAVAERIGDAPPAERQQILADAMKRAGRTACALAAFAPALSLAVPEVAAGTLLAELPDGPIVVVTPTAILVEGEELVAVRAGAVDAAEVSGGAGGLEIGKLARYTGDLARLPTGTRPSPGTLLVAVDPGTPYRLLIQVLYSTRRAYPRFAIVARAGDQMGAVPIALPPPPPPPSVPDAPRLGLVLNITKDEALVWSLGGLEGTLQAPKAKVAPGDAAAVGAALAEIKARRPAETELVIMADGAQTAAVVVPLMATARASFPDLRLSSGLE